MWSRRNYAPVVFLSVEGQPANDLLGKLTSFSYKKNLKKAGEVKLTFRNDDRTLMSDPRLFANVRWQVRYGYFRDLSPIINVVVRGVDPVYADKRTVTLTLYDGTMRVAKSSQGKNWGRVPSSTIARRIAEAHGLQHQVEDSKDRPEKDFIQPASINDLMYLRDLAADIDFEVFVDGNPETLVYRRQAREQKPAAQPLVYYDDPTEYSFVTSFKPKIKSLGPVKNSVSKTKTSKGKADSSVNAEGDEEHAPLSAAGRALKASLARDNDVGRLVVTYRVDATTQRQTKVYRSVKDASRGEDNKPVNTPAAGSANTRRLAASKRQQLLDKAQEATSAHPLTASFKVGKPYNWSGLEESLNRAWYLNSFSVSISGTGSSTSCHWKRDNPSKKKNKNRKNFKPGEPRSAAGRALKATLAQDNDTGAPRVQVVASRGIQSRRSKPRPVNFEGVDRSTVFAGSKF